MINLQNARCCEDLLGAAIAWIRLILARLAGMPDENGRMVARDPSSWVIAFVILVILHAIDAAMTHNFALKGHYAVAKK
jgi:hypothetical protein